MIAILFALLVGSFKALSDLSSEGKIYPKGESWKNKWKLDDNGKISRNDKSYFYYLWLYKPENVEKFPYSSTFLVSLTDFWHKTELARMVSAVLMVLTYTQIFNSIADFAILYTFYMIGFTMIYEPIKRHA